MRVDGQPRLNAAKNLSRLFGRSVMPYDPPNCVRPPHLVRSRLRHFVNQYVGAFRVSNKILAWSRVARDDHRMASVINSVAERWLDPITMINFECRHLYPAFRTQHLRECLQPQRQRPPSGCFRLRSESQYPRCKRVLSSPSFLSYPPVPKF